MNESKTVSDEQPTGFQNCAFLKTSQLHKCVFAYIWYPLMRTSNMIQLNHEINEKSK
jgi:hypothetical protein